MASFEEYALDPTLLTALTRMGYKEPTAVQAEAIPRILQGEDLIALAQTGSGKTAACAIPLCQLATMKPAQIQGLVVVPTRELALQYATEVQKIGADKGLKAFALLGGESANTQQAKLRFGVHILIATPGRLIDFIYNRLIDLSHVKTLVLDEADEMLSMGFYEDLEFIMQCLSHEHQTLLFSATMPAAIRKIAQTHMRNPTELILNQTASPHRLEHKFAYCHGKSKDELLIELLQELNPGQSLLFCQSRDHCETLCRILKRHFDKVDFLHAGLSQELRSSITSKFRQGKLRYLVATDVASRGLDFNQVTHVFMCQLPQDPELYIHRSGRTGRCDREGTAVSLVTDKDIHALHKISTLLRREPTWIGEPPPAIHRHPSRKRPPSRNHSPRRESERRDRPPEKKSFPTARHQAR